LPYVAYIWATKYIKISVDMMGLDNGLF